MINTDWILNTSLEFIPTLAALVIFIIAFSAYSRFSKRAAQGNENFRMGYQLIWIALCFAALSTIIITLPIAQELKGQLFSLIGIVLSAGLALSSTTIIGNALSGLVLNSTGDLQAGAFIHVNDFSGRITEKGLLHVEIQSEDRNLTVLPNLYLATNPYRIIHNKGTIVSVDVTLGYDVGRQLVEHALKHAAEKAGLEQPFMQITDLGDYSIAYRISGVLKEVKQRMTARTELFKAVLDTLHENGIEIVSPQYTNMRQQAPGTVDIPKSSVSLVNEIDDELPIESIVFDKAEQAENIDSLKQKLTRVRDGLEKLHSLEKDAGKDQKERLTKRIENLESAKQNLKNRLADMEKE